jgi:hypothetical protein
MKILIGYVRNKARLKGSMAKGYTIEDALGCCTKYLQDFIATKQRVWDGKENMFMVGKVVKKMGTHGN